MVWKRFTTEDFIKRAKLIHGDKYDYSLVNYTLARESVIIVCPLHGEFEQKPNNHLSGRGCWQCSSEGRRKTWDNPPKRQRLPKIKKDRKKNKVRIKLSERERKDRRNRYILDKIHNDIEFKLLYNIRRRINQAINGRGNKKEEHLLELIGCSISFFKKHIENLWDNGMTWDNHGRGHGKWHIDHIRPCASFNLIDPLQQKQCFHWTNTQPLWEDKNRNKSSWFNGVRYLNGKPC